MIPGSDAARHSVSVAAAIVGPDDRVLAIQRGDNGRWEPPGGVLELDETIEAGLRREVREETGFTVEPVAQTGVYKNMSRGVVALVFRCRVVKVGSDITPETRGMRWLTRDEIPRFMDEAYAVRMLDALDHDATERPVRVRAHDGRRLVPS